MSTRNVVESIVGPTEDLTEYDPDTDPRETQGGNDVPSKPIQALGEAPWLLQISFKTPAGTLINVRAMNSWDLAEGMDTIQGLATQIASTEQLLGTAPARQGGATWGKPRPAFQQPQVQQGPPPSFVPQQAPQNQQPAPMCDHGMPAKFVQGGISKTGRPYKAFWACAAPREQQCRFRQDG